MENAGQSRCNPNQLVSSELSASPERCTSKIAGFHGFSINITNIINILGGLQGYHQPFKRSFMDAPLLLLPNFFHLSRCRPIVPCALVGLWTWACGNLRCWWHHLHWNTDVSIACDYLTNSMTAIETPTS